MTSTRDSGNRWCARGVALMFTGLSVAADAAPPPLTIDGMVSKTLTLGDLAAMPRATERWTLHGKTMTCSGPRLATVLTSAGLSSGEAVRGPALMTIIVASAADGYRAAFTLAELEPTLGNAHIIVADTCDGKALVVAAGDTRGARSVRLLIRLTVGTAPGG